MGVAAPRAPFGVRDPLKSSVTGLSLLVNCYLEIKFHKKIPIGPPPPPPPLSNQNHCVSSIYILRGLDKSPNTQVHCNPEIGGAA